MGERRNAYNILTGKPEGKRPVGRPRLRWGIMLEWILRKYGGKLWTGCIWLRMGPVASSCEHGNETMPSIKDRKFLD
jgi:hypothetical protein